MEVAKKTAAGDSCRLVYPVQCRRLRNPCEAAYGGPTGERPVRILVNCAGVGKAGRTVSKDGPLPLEQFAW